MRWKNQDNLETYGVRLIGWPPGIPMQNPSTLSAAQNTQILNALNEGTMQFLPIGSFGNLPSQAELMHIPDPTRLEETASDMDDYVMYDDPPISGSSEGGVTESSALLQVKYRAAGSVTLVLMLCLGHIPWFRRSTRCFWAFTLLCIFGTFHVWPAKGKVGPQNIEGAVYAGFVVRFRRQLGQIRNSRCSIATR